MPRVGVAWDPTGDGPMVGAFELRPLLRPVPERRRHGVAGGHQRHSRGAVQPVQRRGTQLPEPVSGPPVSGARTPSCGRPPSSRSTWTRSRRTRRTGTSASSARCSIATSSKSATSARRDRRLPRNVEANPAVYGPGATAQNADRRRIYANCPADGGTCDFSTIAMLREHHLVELSRRASSACRGDSRSGFGFNVSYWLSKSLDHLSAMNLSGAAAKPLAGENDLAQNPFDLEAEYGPSLFDARHRFVASASWEPQVCRRALPAALRVLLDDWQINVDRHAQLGHAVHRVRLRRTWRCRPTARRSRGSPPAVPTWSGDPNAGPHTVDAWISRDAFQRLNPQTQAGQFGNAGRNIARGARLHQRRRVARAQLQPRRHRAAAVPRRVVQRAQSRRTSGCRSPTSTPPTSAASSRPASPRLMQFAAKVMF